MLLKFHRPKDGFHRLDIGLLLHVGMHREILESAKYPEVVFHPKQIEGKVALTGVSDVKLTGAFSIHGTDHELTAQVHAELSGEHWKGTSKFEVPYVSWGMKDASNFLLKVKPVVSVEVEMGGNYSISNNDQSALKRHSKLDLAPLPPPYLSIPSVY